MFITCRGSFLPYRGRVIQCRGRVPTYGRFMPCQGTVIVSRDVQTISREVHNVSREFQSVSREVIKVVEAMLRTTLCLHSKARWAPHGPELRDTPDTSYSLTSCDWGQIYILLSIFYSLPFSSYSPLPIWGVYVNPLVFAMWPCLRYMRQGGLVPDQTIPDLTQVHSMRR